MTTDELEELRYEIKSPQMLHFELRLKLLTLIEEHKLMLDVVNDAWNLCAHVEHQQETPSTHERWLRIALDKLLAYQKGKDAPGKLDRGGPARPKKER